MQLAGSLYSPIETQLLSSQMPSIAAACTPYKPHPQLVCREFAVKMFSSCRLLVPAANIALVPESVRQEVRMMSNVGRGCGEHRFVMNTNYDNVVACIPSRVYFRDNLLCTQTVVHCILEVVQKEGGTVSMAFQLAELDDHFSDYPAIQKLKRFVSPDDLLLHLGNFEAQSTIVLKVEHLLKTGFSVLEYSTFQMKESTTEIPAQHTYQAPSTVFTCLARTTSVSCSFDGMMMLRCRLTPKDFLPEVVSSMRHQCVSEYVFLVDCSASMNLFIDSVISTLNLAIKSLPVGCFFNVVFFGSHFRQLFPKCIEYSKSSVQSAVDFVSQMKTNLGGTELYPSLRWVLKTLRKNDMPCQVFVITDVDQEVKDFLSIVKTIKKRRNYVRCHTFGLGVGVCKSLLTTIADVSGGKSVIIHEGERLQEKVIAVLKKSLDPFIMDAQVKWNPPCGYSVVDFTPKSMGTVYCNVTSLAFAFLKRNASVESCHEDLKVPATTVYGSLGGGRRIEIPIQETFLSSPVSLQLTEVASILAQAGIWSKIDEMEVKRLLAVSSEIANTQQDLESYQHSTEIKNDLLHLSLNSDIPCTFTFFTGKLVEREVVQVLPYSDSASKSQGKHLRKTHHHKSNSSCGSDCSKSSSIVSSLARHSFSAVNGALMNIVRLFHPEPISLRVDGQTIDDELELMDKRRTQPYLNEQNGEIQYPSSYFKSSDLNADKSQAIHGVCMKPGAGLCIHNSTEFLPDSDDEDYLTSEFDCWTSLPNTRNYLLLIQLQLINGSWPMVQEFLYAIRVPQEEIVKLDPVLKPHQSKAPVEELLAYFWATTLAVMCFRECFSQFKSEWELIVLKGEVWLKKNNFCCSLRKGEVEARARKLLFSN